AAQSGTGGARNGWRPLRGAVRSPAWRAPGMVVKDARLLGDSCNTSQDKCSPRLVPRTRSSHTICCWFDGELGVQRGTRIIELLVVLDSEVRKSACCKVIRTSESDH